jgi:3',5'-cyclic-AMP phosphodiesterase
MPRLAWFTDLHLNFLSDKDAKAFCAALASTEADCFAISGDIGEARSVQRYLRLLENSLQRPIYFVLGNHDFYGGSIASVREGVRDSRWSRLGDLNPGPSVYDTDALPLS